MKHVVGGQLQTMIYLKRAHMQGERTGAGYVYSRNVQGDEMNGSCAKI